MSWAIARERGHRGKLFLFSTVDVNKGAYVGISISGVCRVPDFFSRRSLAATVKVILHGVVSGPGPGARVCPHSASRIGNRFLLLLLNTHLCSVPSDFTSCTRVCFLCDPVLICLTCPSLSPPPSMTSSVSLRLVFWCGALPVISGSVHMFPLSCLFPDLYSPAPRWMHFLVWAELSVCACTCKLSI